MAGMVEDKVAIVTGAGRGIGRGIALLMAAEGARVVVCDIGASLEGAGTDIGPAQSVVAEIKQAGGEAIASTLSIAELANADKIVRAALDAFAPVKFVRADATTYRFDSAAFDLLFSRFGVMFFAEPARAFANLRTALKPSGRLAFACWRKFDENPSLQVPLRAAFEHVPPLPRPGPEDPGPFSFASEQRVHRILADAGFQSAIFGARDYRAAILCYARTLDIHSLIVGMLSPPSVHSPGGGGGEDQRLARNAAKSFFSCSVKPMLKRWS